MQAGRQRGFTYVMVLLLVALMSLGLAIAGPKWSEVRQREREGELLRIGQLYVQAINAYYASSPGSRKDYPPSLEALLLDGRFVGTRRHLRSPYTDPMLPGQPMRLVTDADGRIRGVFSGSTAEPLRRVPWRIEGMAELAPAAQYRQWIFLAEPKT